VDHRPGLGIRIVDADLFERQLVLEDVIFHAGEAQRTRGVEAGGLQVAGHQFHRGDTARADLGDELLAIRECGLRPPQAESHGIGEVVDLRRAGRRRVKHARGGQIVLEEDASNALLRALLRAEGPLPSGDAAHLMGFVERDDAVELGPGPTQDLLQPRRLLALRAQGRIGYEQHAFAQRKRLVDLPRGQRLDIG
jgi:hypothetical protein